MNPLLTLMSITTTYTLCVSAYVIARSYEYDVRSYFNNKAEAKHAAQTAAEKASWDEKAWAEVDSQNDLNAPATL